MVFFNNICYVKGMFIKVYTFVQKIHYQNYYFNNSMSHNYVSNN